MSTVIEMPVADVVWRQDLYPRIKHDPALVQRYAENLDVLPPIEVNQHNILIDGWHRWTAHRSKEATTIKAETTETATEIELFALAIKRNAAHGWQLDDESKKDVAIRLYNAGTGMSKPEIKDVLSVSIQAVNGYLGAIEDDLREKRKRRIQDMYLACHTLEEIAAAVGFKSHASAVQEVALLSDLKGLSDPTKVAANFAETDDAGAYLFKPPLYNIWTYGKKTNNVSHFGNSEQRILENLLYLYTEPFDIVLDPFAGGGATIDVCRKRLRRYWVSDRKPIVERESEIRKLDIVTDDPALHWSEVTLTYLDPPYWRQAQGKYSDDAEDLANMPLEQFTTELANIVKRIASKQKRGVIAVLLQPTQWNAENREVVDHITDHITALRNTKLRLEYRISSPYSTEQHTPQMVEWAKENKKLLVLTRELIIWRVVER